MGVLSCISRSTRYYYSILVHIPCTEYSIRCTFPGGKTGWLTAEPEPEPMQSEYTLTTIHAALEVTKGHDLRCGLKVRCSAGVLVHRNW